MEANKRAKALLKAAGILAYDPGEYTGECKAPYVVVRTYGSYETAQSYHLNYTLMLVHCYVPVGNGSNAALNTLTLAVKGALAGMSSQARLTGREEADYISESFKALTRAVEYIVLKRTA